MHPISIKNIYAVSSHLELHDVLHFGSFAIANAGMEKAGRHADSEGFAGHSSAGLFAVGGNNPEGTE